MGTTESSPACPDTPRSSQKNSLDSLPPPADLRNPSRLKSQTDADRLRSIKFGHPGTAMFPKQFLSEREVADLLAYLATLREEAGGSDKAAP